jgi:hypothetical protein
MPLLNLHDSGRGGNHRPLGRCIRIFTGRRRRGSGCRARCCFPSLLFLSSLSFPFLIPTTHNPPPLRQRPQPLLRNTLRHPNTPLILRILRIRQLLPHRRAARSIPRARVASISDRVRVRIRIRRRRRRSRSNSPKRQKRCI